MIPAGWCDGEVAVAGLGSSGIAATRLLRSRNITTYVSDSGCNAVLEATAAELRSVGADVDLAGHDLARIAGAQALILSPGIPPDALVVARAHQAEVPVLAELNLGFMALQHAKCIGITGTNGKTTTTALVAHLLREAGIEAEAAGNIGRPLSDFALLERPPTWLVVEASSFQLHDAPDFAPTIGVLTNLAPNHLDRYPSVKAYYADKAQLFRNGSASTTWVLNGDDEAVLALSAGAAGTRRTFSLTHASDAWIDRGRGALMLGEHALLDRDVLHLLGEHNVANALAAALVAESVGVAPEDVAHGLAGFRPLPHRLEPVREVNAVLWINDSKATNVGATLVAISALSRPFVLLLGGKHKGQPYHPLAERLTDKCSAVIAYGEAASRIVQDLGNRAGVEQVRSLDEAVGRAQAIAPTGSAVLLSPACSSFDAFTSFVARGEHFRALVTAL